MNITGFIIRGCTSSITLDDPYAGLQDKSTGITGLHPTRAQVGSATRKVDVQPSLPPVLLDRPLVLHYNGSWMIIPESASNP